ncbi:MAG: LytTR family transcriptional regulator [Lachnospiraceae bacterium]|nr:LytTR family transcriptional regulator [Lachnospiraceae bacterium]
MIRIAMCSACDSDLRQLRDCFSVYSIQNAWADIDIQFLENAGDWARATQEMDVLVCDVSDETVMPAIRETKRKNPAVMVLPIADSHVPPARYVRPEIMPIALFWKPLLKKEVEQTVLQVMAMFRRRMADRPDMLEISDRRKTQYVPYADILYLEAREKKVFLRTEYREFGLRGTLREMEESLPEYFLRCHKSFIVNRQRITGIDRVEQMVELTEKIHIPISRNYKKDFLEALHEDGK